MNASVERGGEGGEGGETTPALAPTHTWEDWDRPQSRPGRYTERQLYCEEKENQSQGF